MRDLYAAAAQTLGREGQTRHAVMSPHDAELVDAWFRLSFGASAIFAIRETGAEEGFDGGVTIRPGTPDDFPDAARLEIAMSESMVPAPSFSPRKSSRRATMRSLAEWREDGDSDDYEFFVAERNGRIVGLTLPLTVTGRRTCACRRGASTSRRSRPSPRLAALVLGAR